MAKSIKAKSKSKKAEDKKDKSKTVKPESENIVQSEEELGVEKNDELFNPSNLYQKLPEEVIGETVIEPEAEQVEEKESVEPEQSIAEEVEEKQEEENTEIPPPVDKPKLPKNNRFRGM